MGRRGTRAQMSGQLELPLGERGEAAKRQRSEEAPMAAGETGSSRGSDLMERVLYRSNLQKALKRVRSEDPSLSTMSGRCSRFESH